MNRSAFAQELVLLVVISSGLVGLVSPNAQSQQLSTSLSTGTNLSFSSQTQTTSNIYSYSYTASSTSTGTITLTEYFTNEPSGLIPEPNCYVFLTSGFNYLGTRIHIHYEAAQPTTMYLLDESEMEQYMNSLFAGACNAVPTHVSASYQPTPLQVGDYDLLLSTVNNPYYLVFTAESGITSPAVTITVGPMSSLVHSVMITTVSTVGFLTIVGTLAVPTTVGYVVQVQNPLTQGYGDWLMIGAIAVWVAIAVVIMILRRKPQSKPKRRSR